MVTNLSLLIDLLSDFHIYRNAPTLSSRVSKHISSQCSLHQLNFSPRSQSLQPQVNFSLDFYSPPLIDTTPLRMSKTTGTLLPGPDPDAKPFYVPPKTRILVSVIGMHRRKDLWGPDGKDYLPIRSSVTYIFFSALEFDPDRFLDERLHKYLTPRPFIFLPFNAGPRICLGQQVLLLFYMWMGNCSLLFLKVCLQRSFLLPCSAPTEILRDISWYRCSSNRESCSGFMGW